MGKRGPRPKPSKTKRLQGTYRQDRAADNEPQPEVAAPEAPDFLDEEAKREWFRISPELLKLGLLSKIDRAALAGYCAAWSRAVQLEQEVAELPSRTFTTDKGYTQKHPLISELYDAWADVRKWLSEFGLSPALRTKVSATEIPEDDDWLSREVR